MGEVMGYKNFCAACSGSRKEGGVLFCREKESRFYGLAVGSILLAPCMKRKKEGEGGEKE